MTSKCLLGRPWGVEADDAVATALVGEYLLENVGDDDDDFGTEAGGGREGVVSSIVVPPTKAETNSFRGW